jgi:hypothetical protein
MNNKVKRLFLAAGLFSLTMLTQAQQQQNNNSIPIPATPAFSILGFEPSSVLRPSSVKDLTADLLHSFDQNGRLLMNMGLEVAPYWLKSRPTLEEKDYLDPTVGQSFLQTLLLSAATVKDSADGKNKLGMGLRFKLANGKVSNAYYEQRDKLIRRANVISAISTARALATTFDSREDAIAFLNTTLTEAGYTPEEIQPFIDDALARAKTFNPAASITAFLENLNQVTEANNQALVRQTADLQRQRTGFILEVAGAGSFVTSTGDQGFEKAGLWATTSYVTNVENSFNFSMRYLFSNRDTSLNSFDAGLSFAKELPKFTVSIEGMLRWYRSEFDDINSGGQPITRVEKDFTYRFAVQSAYRISKDISVNISLGKDFNTPFINNSGYFSIFGINYSFLNQGKVILPTGQSQQ